ncbi:M28 family peptidase [Labilibaculum sp. A4]|nr:M28 family peptidase [Labilibaculum euxinus]
MQIKTLLTLTIAALTMACSSSDESLKNAESVISTERMINYIKELGSDEYQGRKPFSEGEVKTINYIAQWYKEIGLDPINKESYFQDVPLVEISLTAPQFLSLKSPDKIRKLTYGEDFVTFSRRIQNEIALAESDLVFAGYGIVAPEYGWNDYKDLDVKGKTVIVLVNDPGFGSTDKSFFKGNEMTYYGRWTYKFEEAARQGAEGILIIHQDRPVGYPWSVVLNSASVPKLYQQAKDNYQSRCLVEGWITFDAAKQLFADADKNLDTETQLAKQKEFTGFNLSTKLSVAFKNSAHFDVTHNVLGIIKGTDLADEYVFYSAHWDHLGIGPKMNGDSIYNGAVDNGTSLAWMFEIARAFKAMPHQPRRSIVF